MRQGIKGQPLGMGNHFSHSLTAHAPLAWSHAGPRLSFETVRRITALADRLPQCLAGKIFAPAYHGLVRRLQHGGSGSEVLIKKRL